MKSPRRANKFIQLPVWLLVVFVINMFMVDAAVLNHFFFTGEVLGTTTGDTCPNACIARINQMAGKSTGNVKEYYIPLGSGTNNTDAWSDVAGASAYIDTSSYGKMKKVTFEATISVPTGSQKVWVRLYNSTDMHPVWYSEISTDNSGPILLASPAITLDSGNKLYQVQIKSQLKGLTNLTQSRVHITTQ